jgi:hypothetical protein
MELKDWHPRYDIPKTEALQEQKARSLKGIDAFWEERLQRGGIHLLTTEPLKSDDGTFLLITTSAAESAKRLDPRHASEFSDRAIGLYFKKLGYSPGETRREQNGDGIFLHCRMPAKTGRGGSANGPGTTRK